MSQDFAGSANRHTIPRDVGDMIRCISGHGWVTIHFTWLVESWERYAWDVTYIQRCPPSRPQTTKYNGQGFSGFANHQAIPSEVWVVMLGSVAMDGLTYIPHILRVHGKGLTSMGCNTYTGMPSIQATDLPICGSRFGRICKTTKPSTWKCGLW